MPVSFKKDTFAIVIFPRKHNKVLKNLIASLLLSLFLFSNYVVNFTHHHHEEATFVKVDVENKEQNCFICYFQGLVYEPLTQQNFTIEPYREEEIISIQVLKSLFISSDFSHSIWSRGPPVYFIA